MAMEDLGTARVSAAGSSLAAQLPLLGPEFSVVTNRSRTDQIGFARAFAFRMTAAWWKALAAEHRTLQPLRDFFPAVDLVQLTGHEAQLAEAKGEAIASSLSEMGAHQIGMIYTSILPSEYRSRLGIYYTPPFLADRLITQSAAAGVDWRSARVLDPASGGGAFLAPVVRRIMEELTDCAPRILIENIATRIRGYELDPFGAWLSQAAVDATVLPISSMARKRLPTIVSICDSLQNYTTRESFDLVIGNPPYGRIQLDSATRSSYERSLYGHANLYGLFTDLALRHAKRGGIIAYVTPTSFLAGEYFKKLRSLLVCEAPPVTIDFVAARKGIFEDVLQEMLLATYRRGGSAGEVDVHEINLSGARVEIRRAGKVPLPKDFSRPWLLPRQSVDASLVSRLARMCHRLSDWGYTVSTGPLVWNRHKDQLAMRPGGKRFPLIWAESVTPTGQFVWRATKRNHAPYFEARRGNDWLITNIPCVLVQRTTAKEQARRLIAAALPQYFILRYGAVVIENHLNMIRPILKRPAVSADVLAAFLNSKIADQVFRCVSGSVAVSAYELEALPLPEPAQMDTLARLLRDDASKEQIEEACAKLYDKAN